MRRPVQVASRSGPRRIGSAADEDLRVRCRYAVAVAIAALMAAGCGEEGSEDRVETAVTPSVTPTPTVVPTTTPTSTPAAEPSIESALWPSPDRPVADPVEAARSFVTDYIGLDRPHLGEFAEGEPRAGEVEVLATGEDGRPLDRVAATLALRQLDGTNWFVISASSPDVEVTAPAALEVVGSPVDVRGRGRAFEGNVILQIRSAFSKTPLVEVPVIAGAMEQLEPFESSVSFEAPPTEAGAVVALSGSGVSQANGFAAFPVRFSP